MIGIVGSTQRALGAGRPRDDAGSFGISTESGSEGGIVSRSSDLAAALDGDAGRPA